MAEGNNIFTEDVVTTPTGNEESFENQGAVEGAEVGEDTGTEIPNSDSQSENGTEVSDDGPVTLTRAEYEAIIKENQNIKKSYDKLRPAYTKATQ